MSTTALTNTSTIGGGAYTSSIAESPKDTRQIVREEIKKAKDLEKLEEQYKNGEISAFEYRINKAILNLPTTLPTTLPANEIVKYSTVA